MKKFTLKKAERLKSTGIIERLFEDKASSLTEYPLRAVWLETELRTSYPVQVAVSVSRKNFPRATDRNRIKRLMREAYRLNKFILYDVLAAKKNQLALILLYTGKEMPGQPLISDKIIVILSRLKKYFETN